MIRWFWMVVAAIASHPYPPAWWYEKHHYHCVHHQCGWCGKVDIHYCKKEGTMLEASTRVDREDNDAIDM